MTYPFEADTDIEVGSIRIEIEQDNQESVWIWIINSSGEVQEGGAFPYSEFEQLVREYYERRV